MIIDVTVYSIQTNKFTSGFNKRHSFYALEINLRVCFDLVVCGSYEVRPKYCKGCLKRDVLTFGSLRTPKYILQV